MAFLKFDGVKIAGIASAIPSKIVYIDDYAQVFGNETIERYKKMTRICQLRETFDGQTASDLGYAAAEKLFEDKMIHREEIGFLFLFLILLTI